MVIIQMASILITSQISIKCEVTESLIRTSYSAITWKSLRVTTVETKSVMIGTGIPSRAL